MPPNNALRIQAGEDVAFPLDGPSRGTDVVRTGPTSFRLVSVGIYQVLFLVAVSDSGQLVITLNDEELPQTVVGRATGTTPIMGISLVQTTEANSVMTVRNPVDNDTPLTITPHAGGREPVSAHLVIVRVD